MSFLSRAAAALKRQRPPPLPPSLLRVSPEVGAALSSGGAVVALESTIISHGLPWPRNLECALEVEAAVRARGAVPATVALRGGRVLVGLEPGELEELARLGPAARKTSRRDFASVLASGGAGATTVAGTMIAAEMANVAVFVTGGIGGVHRGAETSFDVSADLTELGRTPVMVVCAGVKSILNIQGTLEVLETQGVPVLTLAEGGSGGGGGGEVDFPAFFSPRSGVRSPEVVRSPEAAAAMLHLSRRLGLRNGSVLAVPNPAPAGAESVEAATAQALAEARAARVEGRDVTPFLLRRVAELTGGESLAANLALIRHNAGVGARVAVELASLERAGERAGDADSWGEASASAPPRPRAATPKAARPSSGKRSFSTLGASGDAPGAPAAPASRKRAPAKLAKPAAAVAAPLPLPPSAPAGPLFVGGAVLDILCRPLPGAALTPAASNPGTACQSVGGVARNVAEVFARLERAFGASGGGGAGAPTLVTAMAQDPAGAAIAAHCAAAGLDVRAVRAPGARSPCYVALLDDKGDLLAAVADMAAFDALTPAALGLEAFARPGDGAAAEVPGAGAGGAGGGADTDTCLVDAAALVPRAAPFFVVADANLPAATLGALARCCAAARAPLVFEPISVAKCVRAVEARALPLLALLKPNRLEAQALARAERLRRSLPALPPGDDLAAARTLLAALVDGGAGATLAGAGAGAGGLKHVVVTLGAEGALWLSAPGGARGAEARDALLAAEPAAARLAAAGVAHARVPAPPAKFVKATGAGDALLGCLLWAASPRAGGLCMRQALGFALEGARAAVESDGGAVPADLGARLRGAWDAARRETRGAIE